MKPVRAPLRRSRSEALANRKEVLQALCYDYLVSDEARGKVFEGRYGLGAFVRAVEQRDSRAFDRLRLTTAEATKMIREQLPQLFVDIPLPDVAGPWHSQLVCRDVATQLMEDAFDPWRDYTPALARIAHQVSSRPAT